ncbi:MAG: nucleoside transporter C-terminal domain-containing protein [Pseudomonadota bacterium]
MAIAFLLFVCWLMSSNRGAIRWRPVAIGLALQFALAGLMLWSQPGQVALQAVSDGVTKVVDSAIAGAVFAFGEDYREHFVAFGIPSTIIFFSTLMALLYHFGIIQWVVRGMAWGMRKILPVSGAESLVAAANVFIGNTESPLMVKPYIPAMTRSEIAAMMTAGMATMSGGMLAVYIGMGADAGYLLTASLMAAPGALVVAKILRPEVDQPLTMSGRVERLKSEDINAFQAMTRGASDGLILAATVVAMLIAFIAMVALINMILTVVPDIGGEPLTLQRIFGWLFFPVAWLVGADLADAAAVGNLIGTKLFLTEFLAYSDLLELGDTISDQSRAVGMFVLCGFSSFISIGVQVGGISTLAPERKNDIAELGVLTMFGGLIVTLMSTTLASLFF